MRGIVNLKNSLDEISPLNLHLTALSFVGLLLFGVASLRARVLPRWAAVLVLVGGVLDLVLSFVVDFPFGAAAAGPWLAWMGYAVWSYKQQPQKLPRP